jgi:hypothetical protein
MPQVLRPWDYPDVDPNVAPPGKSIGSALLFLLHMMSKMHPAPKQGGEGSKIAIVFDGSPLFAGEPGPSESNIRRRLGASGNAPDTPFPPKPRRMRWDTYERLRAEDAALQQRWLAGAMAAVDRLGSRLKCP